MKLRPKRANSLRTSHGFAKPVRALLFERLESGMKIKLISENWTDFYTGELKFAVGEVTTCLDFVDDDNLGHGIHYSESLIAMLEDTKHTGKGYLVEVEPVGKEIQIDDKYKAEAIKTLRVLTIPQWLETITPNDADSLNRRLAAAATGKWECLLSDTDYSNHCLAAAATGKWECLLNDADYLNRCLAAAATGKWECLLSDTDSLNCCLAAAATGKWDKVFKCL